MKLKQLFCIILCVAMITTMVLFSACDTNPPLEEVDDLKFDEFGVPVFTDENGKGITLKVWSVIGSPDNSYLDIVNTMFNDYYRANDLQAEISSIPTSNFYMQIANTINTDPKNAPDVIIFHSERLTYFVDQKIILPLDDIFNRLGDNNTFKADNYLDNVIAECKVGDSLYGVPLDVHSGVWYVRQDIIEKNGLKMPTNKAEFESVCASLMEKKAAGTLWVRELDTVKAGIDALSNAQGAEAQAVRDNAWKQIGPDSDFYPVEMSGADNIESGWIPQSAVLQNGGKLANADGTPAWNTSAGLKSTLEMIDSWQGKYIGANRSNDTMWSNFGKGNAIFACEGPWWAETRLNEYDNYMGEGAMGILSLSKLYADDPSSASAHLIYGVGHCFSVSNTQANTSLTRRVAAAMYAQFMTENAIKYTAGGHIPACKAILENPEYTSSAAYNRYLKYMGQPNDYVMLGNTKYFSPVYEQMKFAYIWTLSANKTGTVAEHIAGCYQNAMNEINGQDDL